MRRTFLPAAFLLASATLAVADDTSCLDPAVQDTYRCREIVIEFNPLVADLPSITAKYGLRLVGVIPEIAVAWTEAPVGADVPTLIDQIQGVPPGTGEPGVIEAERNGHMIHPECRRINAAILELGRDAQDIFRNQPARTVLGIGSLPFVGNGVTVAVLDTGVSRSHPELAGSLLTPGIDLVEGTELADDLGNGVDDDGDLEVDRGWGHGTAVAGLIHLVAPRARILPVRVLDDECHGDAYRFAAGVVGAVKRGATVLNLSFGSLDKASSVAKAVRYASDHGVLVVAPVGNSGDDKAEFPADDSSVLAVAALDELKVAWQFTNHDSDVDLSAPGVDVVVPFRDGYIQTAGTSFATAFVAGAAAALRWADPRLRGSALQDRLESLAIDVDPFNPALDGELGSGMPWLPRILRLAFDRAPGLPAPAPTVPPTTPTSLPTSLPTTSGPPVTTTEMP